MAGNGNSFPFFENVTTLRRKILSQQTLENFESPEPLKPAPKPHPVGQCKSCLHRIHLLVGHELVYKLCSLEPPENKQSFDHVFLWNVMPTRSFTKYASVFLTNMAVHLCLRIPPEKGRVSCHTRYTRTICVHFKLCPAKTESAEFVMQPHSMAECPEDSQGIPSSHPPHLCLYVAR